MKSVSIGNDSAGGGGGGGSKREKRRKRHHEKKNGGGGGGGGDQSKGKPPACKWCGKNHHNRCKHLDNPKHRLYKADNKRGNSSYQSNKSGNSNYKNMGVSKKQFEQIRTMISQENRKRKYDGDSDSSSSDSSTDSDFRSAKQWRKRLSTAEACFVAMETGNHEAAFDSDASLSCDTSKKDLFRARRNGKKKVKKMNR